MTLSIGTTAPPFTAQKPDGSDISLDELKGRWVLLYFYPADFTSGCTTEACSLNDNMAGFENLSAFVVGVSSQDRESHQGFQAQHGLQFPLVADTDRSVGDAYSVPVRGTSPGNSARVSFLIDPQGKIVEVWEQVSPAIHADEVLRAIENHSAAGSTPGS